MNSNLPYNNKINRELPEKKLVHLIMHRNDIQGVIRKTGTLNNSWINISSHEVK